MHELGRIRKIGAATRLEMVDETAALPKLKVATPAPDSCRGVFGHVLFSISCVDAANLRNWKSHNMVIALVVGQKMAIGTVEARFHMQCKASLSSARARAVWASDCKFAGFVVCVEFVLARKYVFASFALEVIIMQMLLKNIVVGCIEIATRLQTMPVFGSHPPVLVTQRLVPKPSMARIAADMLLASGKMRV